MKTGKYTGSKSGSALLITILLASVLAVIVAVAARLITHEFRFSTQSNTWNQAMHSAEAGIEVAMAAFEQEVTSTTAWDGWTEYSPKVYTVAYQPLSPSGHHAVDAEFTVTVQRQASIVTASGRLNETGTGEQLTRTVKITVATNFWNPWVNAMTAVGEIDLTGNIEMDSFNSQDPTLSTSNQYDSGKSSSNAVVATICTNEPSIIAGGGGYIDGDFVAGVGGSVDVGGAFTLNGIATNGFDQDIPPVKVDFSTIFTDGAIRGTTTINVLGDKIMSVPEIRLVGSKTLTVTGSGHLKIYVDSETIFSGDSDFVILADPPGSQLKVDIYANDRVLLNNVANAPGQAAQFTIFGTENCDDVSFTGSDDYVGTIYAPNADVRLEGSGDFMGSIVGNEIHCTGNAGFHYDESLGTNQAWMITGFRIASWKEI